MLFQSYEELRATLLQRLEAKDDRELRAHFLNMQAADTAAFLDEVTAPEAALLFRLLPKDLSSEVFSYLQADTQEALISAYSDAEVAEIINGLFDDDLADLLEELPAKLAKRVLDAAGPEQRQVVNRLLQYPEDSAGSMMTTAYVRLKAKQTVAEALHKLRVASSHTESIYQCFVTTEGRKLEGVVDLRTLLAADDNQLLEKLMERQPVFCQTIDDQETVALQFDRYDLLTLPVVDQEHRLVGVITIDDALDVLQEETSEDFAVMAAVQPSEKPYLDTGVWDNAKRRVVWLLLLMLSGMINGSILQQYEDAFVVLPLLVSFIPMLTDTGGNAGSQSSGLMIRGLALGEISLRDLGRVLWKELRIAILVGIVLAAVNFARIYFFMGRDPHVSLTVSVALIFTVLAAKLIGGALPILAKALKLDPALMAAPLITTIVDALSLIIYFQVASWLIPALH